MCRSVRQGADVRSGVLRITIRGSLQITAGFVSLSKKKKKKSILSVKPCHYFTQFIWQPRPPCLYLIQLTSHPPLFYLKLFIYFPLVQFCKVEVAEVKPLTQQGIRWTDAREHYLDALVCKVAFKNIIWFLHFKVLCVFCF